MCFDKMAKSTWGNILIKSQEPVYSSLTHRYIQKPSALSLLTSLTLISQILLGISICTAVFVIKLCLEIIDVIHIVSPDKLNKASFYCQDASGSTHTQTHIYFGSETYLPVWQMHMIYVFCSMDK